MGCIRILSGVLVLLSAVCSSATAPDDWSHPRGPRFNGQFEDSGFADQWPVNGPPVLWRRVLGQGYSGFVVVAGQFYTQFQNASGQHVACFDLDSGEEIWRARYGLPWQLDGDWPGPYATPVHADGHIYFAGCFGTVGCLRARDGKMVWTVNLQERFAGRGTEFGYGCVPWVEGGKVFLPVGGKEASVVALDARSGELIWKDGSEPASYCGSLGITVDGRRQIVSYLENITVGHDPSTGKELWRHTRGHGYAEHAAWPIWKPPYLFYSEPFREGTQVLKLDYINDTPRMQEVWHSDVLCNDIFSSVIVNDHIYGFDLYDFQAIHGGNSDGHFKCIELATGVEKWAVTNTAHATVLTDQRNLLIFNELGELILAEATPDDYREKARARIFSGVQCWVAPAYYDGRLLLRGGSNIGCVYLGDPDAERLDKLKQLATVESASVQTTVFDRYRDESYFAPTLNDLNEWFWFTVIGVVAPVGLLTFLLRGRCPSVLLFGGGTLVGGLIASPLYTGLLERMVFTWPLALHAAFHAAAVVCIASLANKSRRSGWIARGTLLGFIGFCVGYHALCRHYFIVTGWGFLTGILPALLIALCFRWAIKGRTDSSGLMYIIGWMVSYVVFYWSAAVFILLRT